MQKTATLALAARDGQVVLKKKVIAMDAGHVCQNLYLACEAVGCSTCAIGAYDQEYADAVLDVDGEDEFTIYMAPVSKL